MPMHVFKHLTNWPYPVDEEVLIIRSASRSLVNLPR